MTKLILAELQYALPSSQENLWCSDSPRGTQALGTLCVYSVAVEIQGRL